MEEHRAVHGNTGGRFRSNVISKIGSVPEAGGLLSERQESHRQRDVHGNERRSFVEDSNRNAFNLLARVPCHLPFGVELFVAEPPGNILMINMNNINEPLETYH